MKYLFQNKKEFIISLFVSCFTTLPNAKNANENKAILKTCLLPKSEFMGILKYIINY